MSKLIDNTFTHVNNLASSNGTKEDTVDIYNKWGDKYDGDLEAIHYEAPKVTARSALEFCPGAVEAARVLDVGAGTGFVGKELRKLGFKTMDGLEPSPVLLNIAKTQRIYRKHICEFFSKDPLDIPENSYDIIVSCGTLIQGHLPYDCFYEMIRLVKPGGIICIVTRASSFDDQSVPEFKDRINQLMKQLETDGHWRLLKWQPIDNYHDASKQGVLIVYQVC